MSSQKNTSPSTSISYFIYIFYSDIYNIRYFKNLSSHFLHDGKNLTMLVVYKHLWVRPRGSSEVFSEEILCFGKNCRKRLWLKL
jgi:hypothetical protein